MIKAIENYPIQYKSVKYKKNENEISFKGINPLKAQKFAVDTLEILKNKNSYKFISEFAINKVKNMFSFLNKTLGKEAKMPFAKKPLIAAMDTVDSVYANEIKKLSSDAKQYGLSDLYNKAFTSAKEAEINVSNTTGGWSCNRLTEVKNKITDLKNGIEKAKSSGRHYFEDSSNPSFGNHFSVDNDLNTVASSHIDDITEMAQNAKNHVMDTGNLFVDGKNISHLDDVVNIENIHEINAEAFTDIPVLEEMSAFENIKELLGNAFSDMDDTISDIFNVIKEEFLG